jgi:hypothetical protein
MLNALVRELRPRTRKLRGTASFGQETGTSASYRTGPAFVDCFLVQEKTNEDNAVSRGSVCDAAFNWSSDG